MQEKLAITVLVIMLALFALIMILYKIMTKSETDYNQIVLNQQGQKYDSRVLPFQRGNILDRNNTLLATSEKVYNLILDPKLILSEEDKYLEPSVTALVDCFGYDRDEIINVIREKKDSHYVKYEKEMTHEEKNNFEAYVAGKREELKGQNGAAVKGITFETEFKRVYPLNSVACNVIGFMNSDGLGGTGGLEQYYNDVLMGTNGREYGYLSDDSNPEKVIKPAKDGCDLVSTIDVNIQKIVEKHINEWIADPGSKNIGVIVMDPNNGEILAMASDRQFDLNNPRTLGSQYTEEVLRELGMKEAVEDYYRKHKSESGFAPITQEEVPKHYSDNEVLGLGKQVAWNRTWRNYCVSDAYEPGSPAKIFTVAAGLEEGVINGSEGFECQGFMEIGDWKIKCVGYRKGGHGVLTPEQGLMVSCNVVMMQIARNMGKERFYKYQQLFGFGSKTGIDLPAEADTKPLTYTAETADPASLATNSFGQNFNCTMVQMASAYCSIINGGSYYEPHVVKQIRNDTGSVVEERKPKLVRETVSENTSKYINQALWRTVNDKAGGGTGSAAMILGYDVAGKTGTAEKVGRDKKNYLLSFAGYAPADDPQVFIYVVVDEPNVEDQAHSTFASSIFQKIMAEVLPYMNIFRSDDTTELPGGAQSESTAGEGISSSAPEESAGETEAGTESGETGGNAETAAPLETPVEGADPAEDYFSGAPSKLPGQPLVPPVSIGGAPLGSTVPAPPGTP